MDVRLSDVVFLRLSGGDISWLADLRWSRQARALLDEGCRLAEEEESHQRRVLACRRRFSRPEWISLQAWLTRAAPHGTVNTPNLLHRDPPTMDAFNALIDVRRRRAQHETLLHRLLDDEEKFLEARAFERLDDPRVRLLLANTSTDFTATVSKLTAGRAVGKKERRRLARTIWAHLARSTHKSCPLAFAADTSVLPLRGEGPSWMAVGPVPHVVMRPNQELSNHLIQRWRPTGRYLTSGGQLHLNVGAHLYGERLTWWRTTRTGAAVRESLTALRPPPSARNIIDRTRSRRPGRQMWGELSEPERNVLHSLVEQNILARKDFVTPLDDDPWPKLADAAADPGLTSSREVASYREAAGTARHFSVPRPVEPAEAQNVGAALAGLRDLSDQVLGRDRVPSSGVAVDTYRRAEGDLSRHDLGNLRRAIERYCILGSLAYPSTPTYRNRQRFIEHFRAKYGDDAPVRLEGMLVDDWDMIDRVLSFLLSPDHSPVHPDNDLVWPKPGSPGGSYADVYGQLENAAASGSSRYEIEPPDVQPPILRTARSLFDVVCRLGRSGDGRLDAFVESATISGRLIERHLHALRQLDPRSAEIVDRYLKGRRGTATADPHQRDTPALVVASHAIPRLQNLCRVQWAGEPVLAISEPLPAGVEESLIRYCELYVRFDSSRQGFAVTRGPDGVPLDFAWLSPLSPSFSRRLHFLRFLGLASTPVITAPRWLVFEASTGGHLPRLQTGPLVISPERWSLPVDRFDSCLASDRRAGRYLALRAVQDELNLPDEFFAYTSHDTKPAYIDLASPWGADSLLHLLRNGRRDGAATVLMEELFPQPGRGLIDSPSGSCSLIFQCSLTTGSDVEERPPC